MLFKLVYSFIGYKTIAYHSVLRFQFFIRLEGNSW